MFKSFIKQQKAMENQEQAPELSARDTGGKVVTRIDSLHTAVARRKRYSPYSDVYRRTPRNRSGIGLAPSQSIIEHRGANTAISRRQIANAPPVNGLLRPAIVEANTPARDNTVPEESVIQAYNLGDGFKQKTNENKKIIKLKKSQKPEDQSKYTALADFSRVIASPKYSQIALAKAEEVKDKSNEYVAGLMRNRRTREAHLWRGSTKYYLSEFGRWYGLHKSLDKQIRDPKQNAAAKQGQKVTGSSHHPRDVEAPMYIRDFASDEPE